MSARAPSVWASQPPGMRRAAAVVAVLLGVMLYVAFVYAIENSRSRLRASVAALRSDAVKLERNAQEIEQLRSTAVAKPVQGDIRAIVDATARSAGLVQAQSRIDAKGADEVAVTVGSVSFAAWLAWVAELEKQQVRLETCRIEPLSTPGLVSVTATFVRGRL